ncbi:AEC family transporter [Spiroplasma eriocheiris]|uniref:Malate permease n=1 Tax=Spiroplasma eriocheiris TaxID=315358 RepID=A0A0H3XNB5_9MOLU|nr:AEC family transporter [Spiroplasma eriocheiris]AHF58255.1 putative auxin efflux carrier family protein [Spiroplasma eriocheiris CCTCC M 207170]AKM54692.1 malate permease [Spiroplasma eriocheiris]
MSLYLQADVGQAVVATLKAWKFWSAILATIFVIFLGWALTKKGTFKKDWEGVLIKVVMVVGLPSLAFNGFMANITIDNLKTQLAILLVGFLFYIIMGIVAKYFYIKYEKDVQDTLAMCTVFASTTFFGIPVVTALYDNSTLPANIFNIPYRIFLYSLGFIVMSKPVTTLATAEQTVSEKVVDIKTDPNGYAQIKTEMRAKRMATIKKNLKTIFLNPILIATIVGFIFWVTQLIPGIEVVPDQMKNNSGLKYSPLRLDNTFPPFFKVTSTLAAVCTPLAWLAIGMTLAKGDFKAASQDKKVWYGMVMKVVAAPIVGLILAVIFAEIGKASGAWTLDTTGLGVIVIMLAAPPASVIVAYSIGYKKQPLLTSNLTLVSTLFSVISLPFWVIITTAIGATPLFN